MNPFETLASNAYAAAADDRPETRSGGARSRPASNVGRCSGLLPAGGPHISPLPGGRAISSAAIAAAGAAGSLLYPNCSAGDLIGPAGAGASPGGGHGAAVRVVPISFGRTSGDPWTFAPAGQSGRGRLGALDALSSLGLPGEDDCATFEPLGLDEVEPPLQPLSPVRASSNSTHAAHETSPPAGPAPPSPAGAAAAARSPGASDSFGFGGSGGGGGAAASGPQSLRKMVSFTAFPAPGLGEGLSRHEPVAGNSGAATAVTGSFGAARSPGLPAGADGWLPAGGADQHVAVFDVASLMAGADEAEAAASAAAGGRASFLDPSKPAVRRLLPPLWHASQAAACELPLRTISGGLSGLGLSNCSSCVVGETGAGGGGGTAGNSRTNSRAASLNSPGPDGGGVNKAAVDMRTLLLGLSAASPSSTSYCGDADISEAALALGLLLQSPPAAAGSAFGGVELAGAAAAAVQMESPGGGAAARAPSGRAAMLGTGGLFNSSSKRSLPPMDNSRLACTTGLTTGGGDFTDAAAVEPAAGGASLLSRLAALSGPGAAAGVAGAGSASGGDGGGGGGGGGWSGGSCALYRATTAGLEYVQDSAAGRDRASSGSSSCGAAGSYGAAGSTSAATSAGAAVVAGANGCEGQAAQQNLATASTGGGLLRRSETATGALVPSSSGGSGGGGGTGCPGDSRASQLRLLGGLVGMPAAARMLSGTPAFHTAAGTGSGSGETAAGGGAARVEAMRGRSFVISARHRALLCLVPDGAAGGTAADGGDENDNEDEEEGPQQNQQLLAHQHRLAQAQLPLRDGLFRSSTQVTSSNAPAEGPRFAQRPPSTGVLGASLLSPVIGATDRAHQVAWGTPAAASPRPAGPGLPLPPIQDIRARATERR